MPRLKTQVARWGNSLAVRIPKPLAETACLREGEQLSLSVAKDGAIVLRAARRKYRLEELVSKITSKNRHRETEWGAPVGEEIW